MSHTNPFRRSARRYLALVAILLFAFALQRVCRAAASGQPGR